MLNNQNDPENLLHEYLSTYGSTTQFLHDLAGAEIRVDILSQQCQANYLRRESLLYLDKASKPVLYAVGQFFIDNISSAQQQQLLNTSKPVGTIFGINNISKNNQKVSFSDDQTLLARLNSSDRFCLRRSFELMNGTVKVANLTEVVNHQSLQRAVHFRQTHYRQMAMGIG